MHYYYQRASLNSVVDVLSVSQDAFDLTSHARPRILPNYGFWCQLAKLEYDLYKKSTLKRTIDMKALFPYRQEIVVGKPLCGC